MFCLPAILGAKRLRKEHIMRRSEYVASLSKLSRDTDPGAAIETMRDALLDIYERIGNLRLNDEEIVSKLREVENSMLGTIPPSA